MKNAPRHIHSDDASELLSSYMDDALDLVERRRVDKLLHECEACVLELQELRELRQLLRSLPAPMPRRSFTLDASVAAPRMRLFPIFRFASLAAALLLFVVLGADAIGRGGAGQPTTASQPAAQSESLAQEQSRAMNSAATMAPEAAVLTAPAPAAGDALPEATAAVASEAAGGALPEPTAAAASEALPETAAEQAPTEAAAGAASEAQPEAPAQGAPAEPTMGIAGAAPEQDSPPADEQSSDSVAATPAPAEQGGDGAIAPPAGGDPDPTLEESAVLTKNDTSSPDTTTLEERQALTSEPASRSWLDNGWRIAEVLLAALVVALGGATWWTARRRL